MKALILAGGQGSELAPLTLHTPKPMLPIGNFPLLLFQLHQLKQAGITEVILSLSYQPRLIREVFDDGANFGVLLRYHVETTPVGTAGAFKVAEHLIDDTTVVMNGDVLTEMSIRDCLETHKRQGAQVTIAACSVANPRSYGIVEVDNGRVTRFIERPRGRRLPVNTINAGVYVVEPQILDFIPKGKPCFFERDLFPVLLDRKIPFFAELVGQYWREITRTYSYLQSNMDFLEEKLSVPQFVAFQKENHRPSNSLTTVNSCSLIDEQCIVKSGAEISHSVIGSNCRIEEGAIIRNSVVWSGCRIQRNAFVSGSILGRGCLVGEGAQVHSGNILGDKSCLTSYCKT